MTQLIIPTDVAAPVAAYLAQLPAARSRQAMRASLTLIARLLLARPDATPAEVPWVQLRAEHVDAIRAQLGARYAPASVNRHLSALRGLVRTLRRMKLIDVQTEGELRDVKGYKDDRPLSGRALARDEIRQLFAAAIAPRDLALLTLAYQCGMRRDEIARAKLNWLREAGAVIRVAGKGGKVRDVPLAPSAQARLGAWIATLPPGQPPESPILRRLTRHGSTAVPLTASGVYAVLVALGQRAGVASYTPHDLRRTFITELLARGTDPITVANVAGHDDVKTTMLYDRRPADAARAAVATLDVELP
jgi:integrase